jgi:hypothetical protein
MGSGELCVKREREREPEMKTVLCVCAKTEEALSGQAHPPKKEGVGAEAQEGCPYCPLACSCTKMAHQ